jgi:glycerol-3-phosphate dehydrogenase (NAD(P)+)
MSLKVGVISGGSWGTALASLLAGKNFDVNIWAREKEVINSINLKNENTLFLPDIKLPQNLKACGDIKDAVYSKDIVVFTTPSQYLRKSFAETAYMLSPGTYIVIATKGIENGTLKLMNQIAEEILPSALHKNIFVISGPTFARELAVKMPTLAVVAGYNSQSMETVQNIFNTDYFRIYRSNDVTGVELGGALKNIIAIAVGILEGFGLGKNTQAALITRAIAEITRLVIKMGGNPLTISGLSGVGDLILTCTGDLSRNRQVGIRLGKGESIEEITKSMNMVAEGVATTASAYGLAKKMSVEMPITETLYKVLYENSDIKNSFGSLMYRSLKDELNTFGG